MEERRDLINAIRNKGIHVIESLDDYHIVTNGKVMRMPSGDNVYSRYIRVKEPQSEEELQKAKKKLEMVINMYRDEPGQPWQRLDEFIHNLGASDYISLMKEYGVQ